MAAKYPTQEHKHGMYVQLLRDKSEEYLRKSFHKTFSRNPTKLYIEIKKHDPDLQKLLRKGILNQKQYDTLFPPSKQTDSSKFDTTLLFLLLRHFCGYKAPITGWNNEPDQNDRSEIANLIRLKIGRNRIQHLSPSITNAEYKAVYLYLRQPLIDLGCPLNDICHARSFKYDNQPAIRSFLGREDELDQIHKLINNNQPIHGTVITGFPGVGKTELARKYCQEYEQEFEHILWVNCDSLENSFQDIAQSLNLNCRQNDRFKNLKVIAKLVSEYFKNEKVLFVFDNCINGSEDLVDVLFPQHHNIITTQARSWGQDYQSIELKIWPKDIAFDFLEKNMKHGKDLTEELYEEWKDKKNDITLYYIKNEMALMEDEYNAKVNKMSNILLEIEQNVLTPSPKKQELIKYINYIVTDKCHNIHLFHEGDYLYYLKVGLRRDKLYFKAIGLKELKKYGEALELFCKNEEHNAFVNTSLEVACCYILQGEREKGLRLAGKVVDDICPVRVPLQIGRALFDVGFYEQSNKYLYEFTVKVEDGNIGYLFYQVLDAWSKVVIQNYCIEHVFLLASREQFECFDNVRFRARILACCCLIRRFEYTRAFAMAEQLLQDQRKKQCSRMWFREGLLIAKHLMRRHEYYQALLIYQMIQRFQNKLVMPKQTLDGVVIDLKQCIDVCLYSLRKTFKI